MRSRYRIKVTGKVPGRITRIFDTFAISVKCRGEECPVTILEGAVPDQAALMGLLNALYSWHLSLVSVECLDGEPEAPNSA